MNARDFVLYILITVAITGTAAGALMTVAFIFTRG
jgi:hypothetical protein